MRARRFVCRTIVQRAIKGRTVIPLRLDELCLTTVACPKMRGIAQEFMA